MRLCFGLLLLHLFELFTRQTDRIVLVNQAILERFDLHVLLHLHMIDELGKKIHKQKKDRQGKSENENPAHNPQVMVSMNSFREQKRAVTSRHSRSQQAETTFALALKIS